MLVTNNTQFQVDYRLGIAKDKEMTNCASLEDKLTDMVRIVQKIAKQTDIG